ncbi:MAG: protein BatD [Myxococcales bacterium]|nr:protein BatD [Myxococcales bacterium]MCB9732999.1 protein BatD [Deltaproteobacteria bacterium]
MTRSLPPYDDDDATPRRPSGCRGGAAARAVTALLPLLLFSLALALGALPGSAARAQGPPPSLTMTVDKTTVPIGEDLELQIEIEGNADSLEQPDLSAFQVVSQGTSRVIGGRQNKLVQTYTLRPRKAGTATIGGAKLLLGGKVVAQAQPIAIKVAEPEPLKPVSADEARSLAPYVNQGLFARVTAPRSSYYVGEPFTLELDVVTRRDTQLANVETVTEPKLDGLLVEDLPGAGNPNDAQAVRVGDATMLSFPVGRWLATPLRAGKLLIDSSTLRVTLASGLMQRQYTRQTQPFTLDVKPVPTEGRPDFFDEGNLGRFELRAALTDDRGQAPTTLRTGQRMVMRVEVQGAGNLLTLKAPRLASAPGFDVQPLPSTADDVIDKSEDGMRGKRVFQYLVTATQPGTQTTPTVRLAYFDPQARRYETREVPGVKVEVTGTALGSQPSAAALSGEDVRPIFEDSALESDRPEPLAQTPLYWAVLLLPLAAFVAVEVRFRLRRRDHQNPGQRLAKDAYANARKRLRAAERAVRDDLVKDFYGQISRTLIGYLEERANLPATGMTHDELRQAARQIGYDEALVDGVIVELENCDFARFAPQGSASSRMRETLDRVSELLRKLDRVQPRRLP